MGTFKLRSLSCVSFGLFFLVFFISNLTATPTQLIVNPLQDGFDICKLVFCGQGTCVLNSSALLGYNCNCDPGWKKSGIPGLESCLLPNCTVDFQCDNGSVPAAPAPQAFQPPTLNLSDPCLLVFCGDGTCERQCTDFKCQCPEGSGNLLNNPKMACFKQCSLGGDCHDFNIGFASPSPPFGTSRSTPGTGALAGDCSASPSSPCGTSCPTPGTGSGERLNGSSKLCILIAIMLTTEFRKWV